MKYLMNYGFSNDEVEALSNDIPPVLVEQLYSNYRLVCANIEYLLDMGVEDIKSIFIDFYSMFLMDNSNFVAVFDKYERNDLLSKINDNPKIVEFL